MTDHDGFYDMLTRPVHEPSLLAGFASSLLVIICANVGLAGSRTPPDRRAHLARSIMFGNLLEFTLELALALGK